MSTADLSQRHKTQRKVASFAAACAVALVVLASTAAYWWVPPGSAKQPIPSATPSAGAPSPWDVSGRVEELSRSQDRLVTAVIGIVGLVSTLFLVLVGLNIFQTNRNFERDSAIIREYAESQAEKSARGAIERLSAIVEESRQEATAHLQSMRDETESFSSHVKGAESRLLESNTRAVKQLFETTRGDLKEIEENVRSYNETKTREVVDQMMVIYNEFVEKGEASIRTFAARNQQFQTSVNETLWNSLVYFARGTIVVESLVEADGKAGRDRESGQALRAVLFFLDFAERNMSDEYLGGPLHLLKEYALIKSNRLSSEDRKAIENVCQRLRDRVTEEVDDVLASLPERK